MKKLGVVLLTVIVVFLSVTSVSAWPDQQPAVETIRVIKDHSELIFKPQALLINQTAMLPVLQFLDDVDATYQWHRQNEILTAFLDNIQIKMNINQNNAYIAGHRIYLSEDIQYIGDTLYAPASYLARAFNFEYTYQDRVLILTKRDTTRHYIVDDNEFITQSIEQPALDIALPYGWQKLGVNQFGLTDQYDSYGLTIEQIDDVEAISQLAITQRLRHQLLGQLFVEQMTEIDLYETDTYRFHHLHYLSSEQIATDIYDLYILKRGDSAILLTARHKSYSNEKYFYQLLEEILRRVSFKGETLLTLDEHYYEYDKSFSYQLDLISPLHANLEVENFVPLEGTLAAAQAADSLTAIVKRQGQRIAFDISLKNEQYFETKIYTPFGTAKHNIELYLNIKDGNGDSTAEKLMAFSVINTSNDVTQYLIPTNYVQSTSTEALSLANYLTYNHNNSYHQALAIYQYIISDIALSDSGSQSKPVRQSNDILIGQSANPLEMNLLLVTILRAADISARLVEGTLGANHYYAVEAYINGNWVVYDPVSHLRSKQNPLLQERPADAPTTPFNISTIHYYLNLKTYRALFSDYRILNY